MEEILNIERLINLNIDRLELMKSLEWDGRYDLVVNQIAQTEDLINTAKGKLPFKQIGQDNIIADYIETNFDDFFEYGIQLKDLREILDISILFRNGYMLHDVYNGYVDEYLYRFQIDCVDFVHSAAYFYNEAYDYYEGNKEVVNRSVNNKKFENKRIQQEGEIMFRNFREAYINMIFFIESFINSVGFNAYLEGKANNDVDEYQLKGIEKISNKGFKSYSNLSQKIRNISRILNSTSLNVEDEPFKSYLKSNVELRNQYVHSSPEKGKILLSMDDWKDKCDRMIKDECMTLLLAFWKGCYPDRHFPKVIFNCFFGNSFKGHQGRFVSEEVFS